MKGSNGLFAKPMHQYRVSQWELPIFLCFSRKKLDSSNRQSSSRWFPTKQRVEILFLWNQDINIVYPNGNYPFVLILREKKLDSCHKWILSRFNNKFWFPTNPRVQMFFLENKALISCIHPNWKYPVDLAHRENKLDSYNERSLSHFKGKLWFPTKWIVEMIFSRNQSINIVYPNGNYPFLIALLEKKVDSCHEWSSSPIDFQ